jgi:hypothetical protein
MKEHPFTARIFEVLGTHFGDRAREILTTSTLLQYLNLKTRSANDGSKARGSFANHYALYVLLEDYIRGGFDETKKGQYRDYGGARFGDLFKRQRELPFGAKLQNHALNARLNEEFKKYFPGSVELPISRDVPNQRYWVNESLILIKLPSDGTEINLAKAIIDVIDAYVAAKRSAFEKFVALCKELQQLKPDDRARIIEFVRAQLEPSVDARVFEIISYAILKAHYGDHILFWGWSREELNEDVLTLYKTGRTNANDGGIDFVMRPLGRFF